MDRTGEGGGLATGTRHGDPEQEFLPLRDPETVLMNKDMKSGALGYGKEETRRPGPEFNRFGKRILKMRGLGRGGPVCTWHLPCTPSLKLSLGWIQFLFSLTKRAVSITGRGRGETQLSSASQPASQQVSIRQLLVVSSLLLKAASQNSLTPSSSINKQGALLSPHPVETPPPGHAYHTQLQPYQITEGTPHWPQSQLLRQTEKANRPFNA